jgi:hypothetical protein
MCELISKRIVCNAKQERGLDLSTKNEAAGNIIQTQTNKETER